VLFKITRCVFILAGLISIISCNAPAVENIYRKEGIFPSSVNAPVASVVLEWGGKVRSIGSAWLIEGGNGVLFSAKHVTDNLMNDQVELGGGECKIFLSGRVYNCVVAHIPPLRDAVVLKISNSFDPRYLPKPYKIASTPVKVGDIVIVQGIHPHSQELIDQNEKEGFRDTVVPIFRNFYEMRFGNKCVGREEVFDTLPAVVTKLNMSVLVDDTEHDPLAELRHKTNRYFEVRTLRNHRLSFGGLSGGVVLRLNKDSGPEAVGILTAEAPVKFEYDEDDKLTSPCGTPPSIANTIMVTPIESVAEEIEYARRMK